VAVAMGAFALACGTDYGASDGADAGDGAAATEASFDAPEPADDAGTDAVTADADAGAKRFCATQAPLTGVTDFFCADFDGTQLAEGFTSSYVPDGGALVRTTDLTFSPPASFTSTQGSRLTWEKSGPAAITEIEVTFQLSLGSLGGSVPAATGSVKLLEVVTGDSAIGLFYTRGGSIEGVPYEGYYLQSRFCPSACAMSIAKIPQAIPVNVWTKIAIVWAKGGLVKISYNALPVLETSGFALGAAWQRTSIGLVGEGDAPIIGRHVFDNFTVSARRD
jgi:hypothetical protein